MTKVGSYTLNYKAAKVTKTTTCYARTMEVATGVPIAQIAHAVWNDERALVNIRLRGIDIPIVVCNEVDSHDGSSVGFYFWGLDVVMTDAVVGSYQYGRWLLATRYPRMNAIGAPT